MVNLVALTGLVESVEPDRLGSTVTDDVAAAETVLPVASTEPFESETGAGRVVIAGTVYNQTGVDVDASTITLSAGLASGIDQDDEINVYPVASNVVAKVSTTDGDVITARVATAHIPFLRIGERAVDEREAVTLYREGEGYVTLDVPNGTANSDADGLPTIPDGAISPATKTIYIDGPPDFYSDSSAGAGPLLTYAEMTAVADPVWVTMLDGITADNGTIVLNSADTGAVTTEYYPVWLVPHQGHQFRVVVDGITLGGSADGFDVDYVDIPVTLQADDGSDASVAYVDQFQVIINDYTTSDIGPMRWADYVVLYPGSEDGAGVQNPPRQSVTPAEATTPPDVGALPQVAVCITSPLNGYQYGWTTDHIITISGLRVELI